MHLSRLIRKISQNVSIFCWKHFFLQVILVLSEKISVFQFGRKKTGFGTRGRSGFFYWNVFSLEGVKNGGFGRWGRGAFFHWGLYQFGRREKMLATKNVYLDKIYNCCLEHFLKVCILAEINSKNYHFYGFSWFHHENRLVANFHYHICN